MLSFEFYLVLPQKPRGGGRMQVTDLRYCPGLDGGLTSCLWSVTIGCCYQERKMNKTKTKRWFIAHFKTQPRCRHSVVILHMGVRNIRAFTPVDV